MKKKLHGNFGSKILISKKFWKKKKVLITGITGFKGSWLAIWLNYLGCEVYGLGLLPNTKPSLFKLARISRISKVKYIDIKNIKSLSKYIIKTNPEIIFHLAAQPLVLKSYKEPVDTFFTNINGTINILNISRKLRKLKVIVNITTDKVYANNNKKKPFKESDPLGGHDPYSSSKAASEIVIESYKKSFFNKLGIAVSSARAGNVIGGGDWSKDRIVPDFIKTLGTKKTFLIRNPKSIRPWQHVLDSLFGYLLLAQVTWKNKYLASSYNFGPSKKNCISVKKLFKLMSVYSKNLKVLFLKNKNKTYESNTLYLNSNKSKKILNFKKTWSLNKTIKKTLYWYLNYKRNNVLELCLNDIKEYQKMTD